MIIKFWTMHTISLALHWLGVCIYGLSAGLIFGSCLISTNVITEINVLEGDKMIKNIAFSFSILVSASLVAHAGEKTPQRKPNQAQSTPAQIAEKDGSFSNELVKISVHPTEYDAVAKSFEVTLDEKHPLFKKYIKDAIRSVIRDKLGPNESSFSKCSEKSVSISLSYDFGQAALNNLAAGREATLNTHNESVNVYFQCKEGYMKNRYYNIKMDRTTQLTTGYMDEQGSN